MALAEDRVVFPAAAGPDDVAFGDAFALASEDLRDGAGVDGFVGFQDRDVREATTKWFGLD